MHAMFTKNDMRSCRAGFIEASRPHILRDGAQALVDDANIDEGMTGLTHASCWKAGSVSALSEAFASQEDRGAHALAVRHIAVSGWHAQVFGGMWRGLPRTARLVPPNIWACRPLRAGTIWVRYGSVAQARGHVGKPPEF